MLLSIILKGYKKLQCRGREISRAWHLLEPVIAFCRSDHCIGHASIPSKDIFLKTLASCCPLAPLPCEHLADIYEVLAMAVANLQGSQSPLHLLCFSGGRVYIRLSEPTLSPANGLGQDGKSKAGAALCNLSQASALSFAQFSSSCQAPGAGREPQGALKLISVGTLLARDWHLGVLRASAWAVEHKHRLHLSQRPRPTWAPVLWIHTRMSYLTLSHHLHL